MAIGSDLAVAMNEMFKLGVLIGVALGLILVVIYYIFGR
jgi:hypothetical protein